MSVVERRCEPGRQRLAIAFLLLLAGGDCGTAVSAAPEPVTVFRDCADCPEMVVVPAGSFTMGAPDAEADRQSWDGPVVRVEIARPFAMGRYEVTRAEFAKFMAATRRRIPDNCRVFDGKWQAAEGYSWARPNFRQDDRHPVVCVDWYDALAYVEWLNTRGTHRYYLPSEAEFEYANRAGSDGPFPFGGSRQDVCRFANVADRQMKSRWPTVDAHDCDDGYVHTAPVGSFAANRFGLYDTFGNVWEWVFDCWSFDHKTRPTDGSPLVSGEQCHKRVIKGAGYESIAKYARAGSRGRDDVPDTRIAVIGFRVAASLDPVSSPAALPPAVRRTTLLVSDLKRSLAFYESLGLTRWYDKSSTRSSATGVIGSQDLPLGAAGFKPLRPPYAFTVPGADAGTLTGRRAFVRDPDDHLIELSEPAR